MMYVFFFYKKNRIFILYSYYIDIIKKQIKDLEFYFTLANKINK